jgi:hypothetical protein
VNRVFAIVVAVAVVALLGFGVFVFVTGGQRPALSSLSVPEQPGEPATPGQPTSQPSQPEQPAHPSQPQPAPPASPAVPATTTPEAAARFDAWAKPLRDAGLTLSARSIDDRGDTLSVAGLTVTGPDQLPRWRWTVENASVYDREPFHLQTAGETTITVTTGPNTELSWSGRVDAFGVALQRDSRDVLSRSIIFRANGLSLSGAGDAAPLTLSDGQLRLLLGGGTGLLPPGTKFTLRLTDLALPAMAGSALGSKLKSFTTEFALGQKLTGYSLPDVLGLFESGGIRLGTVALDWGTLHFIGGGDIRLGRTGVLDGRLDVKVTDAAPFLDALGAAGGVDAKVLADTYAAVLLEMGADPSSAALPFAIVIKAGAVALEGASRGLGDISLGVAPSIIAAPQGP